eukprot:352622-Chlamydomonas_euryale.AAC.6
MTAAAVSLPNTLSMLPTSPQQPRSPLQSRHLVSPHRLVGRDALAADAKAHQLPHHEQPKTAAARACGLQTISMPQRGCRQPVMPRHGVVRLRAAHSLPRTYMTACRVTDSPAATHDGEQKFVERACKGPWGTHHPYGTPVHDPCPGVRLAAEPACEHRCRASVGTCTRVEARRALAETTHAPRGRVSASCRLGRLTPTRLPPQIRRPSPEPAHPCRRPAPPCAAQTRPRGASA